MRAVKDAVGTTSPRSESDCRALVPRDAVGNEEGDDIGDDEFDGSEESEG